MFPLDSVIQPSNNRDLQDNRTSQAILAATQFSVLAFNTCVLRKTSSENA